MTFADLITDRAIALSLDADDLASVLRELVARLGPDMGLGGEAGLKLARDLAFGSRGEIVRINDDVVLLVSRVEEVPRVAAALGVSRRPFSMSGEGTEPRGEAQAVVLLLTPRSPSSLRESFVPALVRSLRDEDRTAGLLRAASAADVRAMEELMGTELREHLRVEDALTPLKYRIYPDTPLDEVVDLMIRRALHAVPVVGESLEVLGIISVGDVLEYLLPGRRKADAEGAETAGAEPGATARDVMTRTVMCVSEDQSLLEAANLMINRDVAQLPVVREGELIGFLTRYASLSRLFGE